ncbi:hypothetical protein [Streptomyces venezuelae]|uniref:hypothetical protein n=1 Tax=Streptomyces venezuelae TaxID=54571 RepID=UPI003423DEE7
MRVVKYRKCLEVENSRGPWVALHISHKRGHDWAWGLGLSSDRGHLWLEVRHGGKTKKRFVHRAPDDGASGQNMLSTPRVYDGPGYKVRTCGAETGGRLRTCTWWH